MAVINNDKPAAQQSSVAKPTVKPLSTEKLKTAVKRDVASGGGVSEKNKRTAALLTHMFNTDPRSKEAYIQIVNKSKCNLIVKISGKKFYNLTVPANGQNFILVDKGSYSVTTSICDAVYNQTKALTKDVIITLKGGR